MKRRSSTLLIALMWIAPAAPAQSHAYIMPDSFAPTGGDVVVLTIATAAEGKKPTSPRSLPWSDVAIDWLYIRTADEQHNYESVDDLSDPDSDEVHVRTATPGPMMIGIDFAPRVISLAGARLDGRETDTDSDPVSVEVLHSAKALINITDDTADVMPHAIGVSLAGQRAEIRPVFDPASLRARGELVFEIYLDARETAGRVVMAKHFETGTTRQGQISESGQCAIEFDRAGLWGLSVQLVESLGDEEHGAGPRFRVISASLTFELDESVTPEIDRRKSDDDAVDDTE